MTALRLTVLAAFASGLIAQPRSAADLGRALVNAGLDASHCYRVRDLTISQDDVRFYLTDGYLIFGTPVDGAPVAAAFTADVEGGDAEVLLLPPNRAERKSLANYTGSPNLDEHFSSAIFLFTEPGARGLEKQIRAKGEARNSAEAGALLKDEWSRAVGDLTASFESRVVLDLISGAPAQKGLFAAIIHGKKLGNFEVGVDGRAPEQIYAGQLSSRDGAVYFDTWTSFTGESQRNTPPPAPEEDILSYRIEATLDPSFVLHCVTRIRVRAKEESRLVLPFNLSAQMRAIDARVDGMPAEVYEPDSARQSAAHAYVDELMLVVPPRPLTPGSEHEIEIHHEGKVVLDAGHQVYFVRSRSSWYPDRGAQFATYDVTYRYPTNLDLVSAGKVVEDRSEDDIRITRRIPDGRIRSLAFNLGVYRRRLLESNGTEIEVSANRELEDALRYRAPENLSAEPASTDRAIHGLRAVTEGGRGYPQPVAPPINPVNQLSQVADDIAAAVEFYRMRFGDPPLSRIEVSPVPGRFGQGFAGMIYLSTLSYLPVTARPLSLMPAVQQLFFGEYMRAHEVAHQWWGNVVTTGSYRDEWLMEALATYSAFMFLENRHGAKMTDTMLTEYRRQLLARGPDGQVTESEGPVVEGRRLENSNNPNAWSAIAYGKGAWILHMLRRRLGDEAFLRMLAALRQRYEWKTVDTEDFRLLCAEFLPPHSADPKLENFFDEWVYGTGVPTLKLNYSVKGRPGAWKLVGTVTQSDVPDDFSVPVPIDIQTARGRIVKLVETGSDSATFTVPVGSPNAKAMLDPAESVLRR